VRSAVCDQHNPEPSPGIAVSALCLGILPFGAKVAEATSYAILDTRPEESLPPQYAGVEAEGPLAALAQVAEACGA
jgi:hypothetical protein